MRGSRETAAPPRCIRARCVCRSSMKSISARDKPGAGAEQHGKSRARHPRGALEIQNAQARRRDPSAPAARNRIVAARPTCERPDCPRRSSRQARSRAAGSETTSARPCAGAPPDRARCRAAESAEPADDSPRRSPLASLPCRFARATSSPAVFCSRFRPSSSGISRRRRFSSVASASSSPSAFNPAASQAAPHLFLVISNKSRIKHGGILL